MLFVCVLRLIPNSFIDEVASCVSASSALKMAVSLENPATRARIVITQGVCTRYVMPHKAGMMLIVHLLIAFPVVQYQSFFELSIVSFGD